MIKSSSQIALEQYISDFPFIKTWIDERKKITEFIIKVGRVDIDVLASRPQQVTNPLIGYLWSSYFCVGKNGEILRESRKGYYDDSGFKLFSPSTWTRRWVPEESVYETISALGNGIYDATLAYIVCVDDREILRRKITIYKLPKGLTIPQFVVQEKARIRAEVEQQIKDKSE